MSEPKLPGEITQQTEALKRRIYERIGEWILKHWTQLASGIGGVIGGAATVYFVLASHVENIQNTQLLMAVNIATLTTDVGTLHETVGNLATRDYVETQVAPLRQWAVDHGELPSNKEAEEAMKLPPHRKPAK